MRIPRHLTSIFESRAEINGGCFEKSLNFQMCQATSVARFPYGNGAPVCLWIKHPDISNHSMIFFFFDRERVECERVLCALPYLPYFQGG